MISHAAVDHSISAAAVGGPVAADAGVIGSPVLPPEQILPCLRAVTVLLLIDRLDLYEPLRTGLPLDELDGTRKKVVSAGRVLGIVEVYPDGARLADRYPGRDRRKWDQLIAIIGHQVSYLELALAKPDAIEPPVRQLGTNRDAYLAFLRGVDASHRRHAEWLANCSELTEYRVLVDLGGGLGTFSRPWAASVANRRAILLDLPGVYEATDFDRGEVPGVETCQIDLCKPFTLPQSGDVYLFANVLHLFADWRRIIADAIRQLPPRAVLAVMEADGEAAAGRLFDLQVHLRSGRSGGLLVPGEITSALGEQGRAVQRLTVPDDPDDPFHRAYRLWISRPCRACA